MMSELYLKESKNADTVAECWLDGYGCEINLNCFWNSANEAYKNVI